MEVDRILESGSEFWGKGERQRLLSEMPDFKPLVKRVICDLPDGIWMEIVSDEEENWAFLSDEGEIKGIFQKTMEGRIVSIDQGNIILLETTDYGELKLKIYKYSTSGSL